MGKKNVVDFQFFLSIDIKPLSSISHKRWRPAWCTMPIKPLLLVPFTWLPLQNTIYIVTTSLLRFRKRGPICLLIPELYLHKVDCSSGGFMVAPMASVNSHLDLDELWILDVLVVGSTARCWFGLTLQSLSISQCEYMLSWSMEDARKAVCHPAQGKREYYFIETTRYWV